METEAYLARQPILGREGDLFAYELLYRDPSHGNAIRSHNTSTAKVLFNLLNNFGLPEIVGDRPAFVKVDDTFLRQEHVLSIPKEKFVFSLFDTIEIRQSTVERIAQLHGAGYRFAVNDARLDHGLLEKFSPLMRYLDYVKVDMAKTDCTAMIEDQSWARSSGISFIATKVETSQMHRSCLDAGAACFQGYYFAEPELQRRDALTAEQLCVMKIWKLIMHDAPSKAIIEEFEQSPTLMMQLIKYLNSAAFSFNAPIRSIGQVIMLLGRMPLMQWLLLLIHAKSMGKEGPTPIQSLLINRVETMVGLHRLMPARSVPEREVYFVALLSFIEVLFGMPIGEVIKELNVDEEVCEALIRQKGELGALLSAARSIEHFDTVAIDAFLEKYGIEKEAITPLMVRTMEKVNRFEAGV